MKFPRSFGHGEKIVYLGKQVKEGVRNDGEKGKKDIQQRV
jgi:hypothetical protein